MSISLTELREEHLLFVKEIYDYHTLNTSVVYFLECPSIESLKTFIPIGNPVYRSYIIRNGEGTAVGFCYYSKFRAREAFQRSVELTIYLKQEFGRHGYGTEALTRLEAIIRAQGFANIVALIGGENEGSLRLFEKNGYTRCAHLKEVAEKFGRKLDLMMYQKLL